jgi:hypothetical protein
LSHVIDAKKSRASAVIPIACACNETFRSECRFGYCEECNNIICPYCSIGCSICTLRVCCWCEEQVLSCDSCRETTCTNCNVVCSDCEGNICMKCAQNCDTCHGNIVQDVHQSALNAGHGFVVRASKNKTMQTHMVYAFNVNVARSVRKT